MLDCIVLYCIVVFLPSIPVARVSVISLAETMLYAGDLEIIPHRTLREISRAQELSQDTNLRAVAALDPRVGLPRVATGPPCLSF